MSRSARPVLLFLAGLILLFVVLSWRVPAGLELTLTPVAGKTPLLVYPIRPGERFTLHYIHSVNHRPIWEEHSVDPEGRIYVEEERFVSFSAGMGYWEGHGRLVKRGEHQVIEDIHWPVGRFILRVGGPGVDHTIIWRGRSTSLSRLVPGQALVVAVRKVGLMRRLWCWLFPYRNAAEVR